MTLCIQGRNAFKPLLNEKQGIQSILADWIPCLFYSALQSAACRDAQGTLSPERGAGPAFPFHQLTNMCLRLP